MKSYVIIPGCSDLNRGDQALVWETKRFGEKNGYIGEYYLTTELNEPVNQSEKEGLHIVRPIMEHPSRKFRNKSNIQYTLGLKIKWGVVAVFDFLFSLLYLSKPTRVIIFPFLKREKRQSLRTFERAEAVFVKGGGLLQAYGGITSTYSMYFWCFHIFLAHSLGKPVYMMPNSLGPFEGPFVKKIAEQALKCCDVVCSREKISEKMVKDQLNLNISTYPDLAFSLDNARIDKYKLFNEYDIPFDRKLVAITMRPYRFPESKDPSNAYLKFKHEMGKFITWLYDKGYMAVIVEHTLAVNAHENDGNCIKDVVKNVNENKYRIISNKNYNCRDLKAIYGMFDYIVGTRFHSVIFSLGNNVPGIAICYVGNKAQGIMKDIGLDDYAVSIYEVTEELLEKKFNDLVNNRANVVDKIKFYNSNVESRLNQLGKLCTVGR